MKSLNVPFSWLIILLCLVNIKLAICYKCYYENYLMRDYYCNIKPDSSNTEEKHVDDKTDDDVSEIYFNATVNGISHVTESELTPFCQRFEELKKIHVYDIKSVDENMFQQCRNVKEFWISYSEVEEIPENLYLEHPQLIKIYIFYSKLRTLPEDVFVNQKDLEDLDLNENQISCLPSNIFKSLTKLKWLTLSYNKIQSLNPKWFENLQSLTHLFISSNKIQDLPKNVFAQLKQLEELYLFDNQLTTIHSDSFGIHRNLKEISLQNNSISAIDEKLLNNIAVKELYMNDNVCSSEEIEDFTTKRNKMKKKLSNCFKNYKPRDPYVLSTDCISQIKCGTRHIVKQLIHGGTATKRGEFPWNVALMTNEGGLFCGGSLVSNRHIVTAAHCIRGKYYSHAFGPDDFSVLLGVHNYSNTNEEGRISIKISRININEVWNTDIASYDGDIAVLELASEVQFNNFIRPICLADEIFESIQSSSGTVVGFGHNENGTLSDIANKLEIPIRNYHNCTSYSKDHHSFISFRTFCGGPADGRGVCSGDSGGGVYVLQNGQFYLRGLVSASLMNDLNQCDIHKEAIFTDVTKYYEWIEQSLNSSIETSSSSTPRIPSTSSMSPVTSRATVRYYSDRPIWN